MRIAVMTALWRRPSLAAYVLERWSLTGGSAALFAVGSEGDASRELASDYGFDYIEAPNDPLSFKWQALLDRVREKGPWDYVIRVDSDDVFSSDYLETIIEACPDGGACGLADLWMYDRATHRLGYFPGYLSDDATTPEFRRFQKTMGSGRCYSRASLDTVDWHLWTEPRNSGLDAASDARLGRTGRKVTAYTMAELGVFEVDVKTSVNIWTAAQHVTLSYLETPAAEAVMSAWGLGDLRERVAV